jgi:hypothetical protein
VIAVIYLVCGVAHDHQYESGRPIMIRIDHFALAAQTLEIGKNIYLKKLA